MLTNHMKSQGLGSPCSKILWIYFEIVGLNSDFVELCFTNTTSRIRGRNFNDFDNEIRSIDEYARSNLSDMNVGGLLKYIHGGEYHTYNPEIVKNPVLQKPISTTSPLPKDGNIPKITANR